MHPHLAVNALQDFWLNDLSRGYIQFIRDRVAEGDETSKNVLSEVYLNLIKLCGPTIPFVAEEIYQNLRRELKLKEESIHLNSWPNSNKKLIDKKLEENFELGEKVMQEILSERENVKMGIRWPLPKAEISVEDPIKIKSLQSLIEDQTNIKKLILKKGKLKVKLDTKLTKELEQEGFARELTRRIQNLRKKSGLKRQDSIILNLNTNFDLGEFIEDLKEKVGAKSLTNKITKTSLKQNIKGKEFLISISKI